MLPSIDNSIIYLNLLDFMPELLLCVAVVILLVLRLFRAFNKVHLGSVALVFTLFALAFSVTQWLVREAGQGGAAVGGFVTLSAPDPTGPRMIFGDAKSGLLVYDHLTVFLRCFLYGFMALV